METSFSFFCFFAPISSYHDRYVKIRKKRDNQTIAKVIELVLMINRVIFIINRPFHWS